MQSLIELGIVVVSIIIFAKLAGVFKKFSLSAGFKKYSIIISLLVLIGLNVATKMYADMQGILVGAGLVAVILFTLALMAETKTTA